MRGLILRDFYVSFLCVEGIENGREEMERFPGDFSSVFMCGPFR